MTPTCKPFCYRCRFCVIGSPTTESPSSRWPSGSKWPVRQQWGARLGWRASCTTATVWTDPDSKSAWTGLPSTVVSQSNRTQSRSSFRHQSWVNMLFYFFPDLIHLAVYGVSFARRSSLPTIFTWLSFLLFYRYVRLCKYNLHHNVSHCPALSPVFPIFLSSVCFIHACWAMDNYLYLHWPVCAPGDYEYIFK